MEIYGLITIGIIIFFLISYLLYLKIFGEPPPTTTPTSLKGREGYVIKKIQPEKIKGKVKVIYNNKVWSATADEEIETGTRVRIKKVEGVHLIVEDLEKEEEMEEVVQEPVSEVSELTEESTVSEKEIPEPEEEGRVFKRFSGIADPIRDRWSSMVSFLQNKLRKERKSAEEETTLEEIEGEEGEICSACGAVIPLDTEKCPECGAELEPPEEEREKDLGETQICPRCGAEVSSKADDCPECAEPLGEVSEEDIFEEL